MHSIDRLLSEFRRSSPGSPRLTWYGLGGERVELSGKVLDNWVAKTANFLSEEFDFGPGHTLDLALPAHWKSLCLALAALSCGGAASALSGDEATHNSKELLASSEPGPLSTHPGPVIAVALGALALRWDGELSAQASDYAAEVRSFADSFDRFEELDDDAAALRLNGKQHGGGSLKHRELSKLAERYPEGSRVALSAQRGLEDVLLAALASWSSGGSVVLFEDDTLITEQLLSSERAELHEGR